MNSPQIIALSVSLSICAAVFVYIGIPWIYGRCAKLLLRHKAVKSKALVFTFDDGPSEQLTPAILNLLTEHNVKAAFFLLGKKIAGQEPLVKKIAAEGHDVCSHGYDHLHYWKVSPIRAIKDIKLSWRAIDTALSTNRGKYPFRPPGGKLNIACLLYLLIHKVPIIYWSDVSGDTLPKHKHNDQRVAQLLQKTGGVVVLMHDFKRNNPNEDNIVIDSIRAALSKAKNTQIHVISISQLLNSKQKNQSL